jgi:hypothetical protein
MQSSVPTNRCLSLPGGVMQSNGGEGLVGVDVSKAWLDVCRSGARQVERIANTPEAVAVWIARTRPRLLAMEPTGGYERVLCLALAEAGVRYVKFHPNAILAFRKARGLRAKTDRIDAMLIAQYLAEAEARGDLPEAIPVDERLRALAARRRQLVDARQAECCRADLAADPLVRESLSAIIAALSESLIASPERSARCAASAALSPRPSLPTCPSSAVSAESKSPPSSASPPRPTKAEHEAAAQRPVTEDPSCDAPFSTPPERQSVIPRQCATSTTVSSRPMGARDRAP